MIEGTNPYPHITVSTYTDLPGQPRRPADRCSAGSTWLADNWQTLAMIVLGCFCLLMLRSMVRSTAGRPAPTQLRLHWPVRTARDWPRRPTRTTSPEPAAALRKRFQSSGPNLKAELHELVKENPDAAANVLRMWIGDAA